MAIQNDFTIYPYSKVIRHTGADNGTVYTVNQFYSWLMDTFDEPGFLSYEIPMRFNTPTSFTMLNGWFLDDGDGSNLLSFLTGGGIDTSGYGTITDNVIMLDIQGSTDWVAGDLDRTITDDASDVGPLLSYKNDYPTSGQARIWIRDVNEVSEPLAVSSAIATTGGTGAGTAKANSTSGDDIYHNLFTIASFTGNPDPQLYIYQQNAANTSERIRLAEWSNLTNWDRDASGIDVLFPIQLSGSLIDGGSIATFVRQTGDTYTFVESTLTAAGRTPIATETAADEVNVTKGEHYMFYNGATSPTFVAGDIIQDVAYNATTAPTWYAEVVAHTSWDSSTGYLTLRGLRGTPADTDDIFVAYIGSGGSLGDSTANVNGTVGDTFITWNAEAASPVAGDIGKPVVGGTSGAERIVRSYQDDGTSGKLLLGTQEAFATVDGRDYGTSTDDNRVNLYKNFSSGESISAAAGGSATIDVTSDSTSTTIVAGYNDIAVLHINGTHAHGGTTGTFTVGERVTWNGGSSEAWIIEDTGSQITLANVDPNDEPVTSDVVNGMRSGAQCTLSGSFTDNNVENFAFALQSEFPYSVFIEGGSVYNAGRTLEDVYMYLQFYVRDGQNVALRPIYQSDSTAITLVAAEEYISANSTYTATKAAPFGTLAGGVFFGAQAVWIQGIDSSDNNSINLLDRSGTLRQPFTSINLTISNTRQGDRIAIFLESGSTELPDKIQYTSNVSANIFRATTFEKNEAATGNGGTRAFPNDTPTSGRFFVVDTSLNSEHHYRYDSFDATGFGGAGVLNLPAEINGISDGLTGGQLLIDESENWTGLVQVGDIVHRIGGQNGYAYVTALNDLATGNVSTTLLRSSNDTITFVEADRSWTSGDQYAFHSLVKDYDSADTFFIPYMDIIESTGSNATPGTETVTLTYVSDREIILEVRNVDNATDGEIVAFKTTGSITSGGYTQGVIRNEDTVYTP